MKQALLALAALLLAPLAALPAADAPKSAGKPNLVFFLVDDLGWQETSAPFHTEATTLNPAPGAEL